MELHISIHNIGSFKMELKKLSKAIALTLENDNQEIILFLKDMRDFVKFKHLINNLDLE